MRGNVIQAGGKKPTGNAIPQDVLKGKTFSANEQYDYVGSLEVERGTIVKGLGAWEVGTTPTEGDWRSICYGNGMFVAVASSGTALVMTSPDGITWTARTPAASVIWSSVCYANGLFVAVGGTGATGNIMTSPDGITWTTRTCPIACALSTVAWGNGVFVAGASKLPQPFIGGIISSPDGITWTVRLAVASYSNVFSIIYGNGRFVASCMDYVRVSTDGISWTTVTSLGGPLGGNGGWKFCYDGSKFVGIPSFKNAGVLAVSSNGVNWSMSYPLQPIDWWMAIAYGNGYFIGVSSVPNAPIVISKDLITWESVTSAPDCLPTAVCYGNGNFVMVGKQGTGNRARVARVIREEIINAPSTGVNLKPFVSQTTPVDNNWIATAYGNGTYVSVGNTGTGNRAMTSPDGITWTVQNTPLDAPWAGIAFGNGIFVAIHNAGAPHVMTSPDGVNWTLQTTPSRSWIQIAFGNGIFVVTASTSAHTMVSSDGINWTEYAVPTYANPLVFGNGKFVALGFGYSVCMVSTDGINWSTGVTPESYWDSIAYGNGTYLTMKSGKTLISTDGLIWKYGSTVPAKTWHVCYGNGLFVATTTSTTDASQILVSLDGINWEVRTSPATNSWRPPIYANGKFIATSYSGTGNRVMTAECVRESIPGAPKSIQALGLITGTFVSATVVDFNVRARLQDPTVMTIQNFLVEFIAIQKATIANANAFTWSYTPTTGIIRCTSNNALFAVGTTTANIFVVM